MARSCDTPSHPSPIIRILAQPRRANQCLSPACKIFFAFAVGQIISMNPSVSPPEGRLAIVTEKTESENAPKNAPKNAPESGKPWPASTAPRGDKMVKCVLSRFIWHGSFSWSAAMNHAGIDPCPGSFARSGRDNRATAARTVLVPRLHGLPLFTQLYLLSTAFLEFQATRC